jgi:glycosyltransferase involved in cell wall biosynthesis
MLDLAVGLRDLGVSVGVGCPRPSPLAERVAAAGLPVVAMAKRGLVDWSAIGTLWRLLRSGEVDLIHAHNGRTALQAALAVTLSGRGRCMMTQHFLEPSHATRGGLKGWLSHVAHNWVGGRMAGYIAISDAVRERMLARGDCAASQVRTVLNGIVDPAGQPLRPSEAVRAEFGIEVDAPLIVSAARLEKEKDVATLLRAMQSVVRQVPGAVCLIAGGGTQAGELACEADRLGVTHAVRFAGFRADVLSLMNAADVFALPSPAEPFGLVLLEAMALSRPVVATAAGGPLEIVVDGVTGRLVPPGDDGTMAKAINEWLHDETGRRAAGAAGRARYEQLFTADRMAAGIMAVYQDVMARTS